MLAVQIDRFIFNIFFGVILWLHLGPPNFGEKIKRVADGGSPEFILRALKVMSCSRIVYVNSILPPCLNSDILKGLVIQL